MINLVEEQIKAERDKIPYALVTLVKTSGATPRSVGSKMLVFSDGTYKGTIGGGILEKKIIEDAVRIIRTGGKELNEYENKSDETDSPCGGFITAFIEAGCRAPHLIVCGAGHVGGIIIHLAGTLGYYVTAIDTRDSEQTAENVKYADQFILTDSFSEGVESVNAGPDAFYMVSTYGHKEDCETLEAILSKSSFYVGMMGSPAKINMIFQKLRDKGFSEKQLSKVHAPVGLDIGGETPAEIALSVLAQMQMLRYSASGRPLSEIK